MRLVWSTSALIRLASIENASPPTKPIAMQVAPESKDIADQQHSHHQFRVDRGASGVAVEFLVDPPKIEQGMIRRTT